MNLLLTDGNGCNIRTGLSFVLLFLFQRPPDVNPESTSIFLFPGQGSQYVGMGKDLIKFPKARQLFNCASEILRTDLIKTCLDGPPSKLNQTIHCQPAIYTVSLAAVSKLQEEEPSVSLQISYIALRSSWKIVWLLRGSVLVR